MLRAIDVQFQRWCLNWCSHSLNPMLIPRLISRIMSVSFLHISWCLPRNRRDFLHIKCGSNRKLLLSALKSWENLWIIHAKMALIVGRSEMNTTLHKKNNLVDFSVVKLDQFTICSTPFVIINAFHWLVKYLVMIQYQSLKWQEKNARNKQNAVSMVVK